MSDFLFEKFMQPCQMMDHKTEDGPFGVQHFWVPGAKFEAALIKGESIQAKVAEKEGVKDIYTVYTRPDAGLDFHDVFKRLEDGAIFRVTTDSADSKTPKVASFQFAKVSAERWELPK